MRQRWYLAQAVPPARGLPAPIAAVLELLGLVEFAAVTRRRDDRLAEIDAAYEGAGGTEGPEYAYTSIYASGERWLVGGWDGLAVTADAGVNWQEPMLLPPDYTRGLEFSPSYAEDGILFVGAYAAGPIRSEDWGRTFDAPGLNLQQPNVQKVHVPAYAEDPSTVFGIVNLAGRLLLRRWHASAL